MSNENTKTPISKATNVAEDINNDSDLENVITSEFVIVSSDEQSEEIADSSTIKKEIDNKKTSNSTKIDDVHQDVSSSTTNKKKISSKDQHKKKRPSDKMLNAIKQEQEERKNAQLKADEEAKKNKRLQEEYEQKQREKLRLEQEYRDKIKEKEKIRILRQRDDGSYLTKEQRKKFQRAQVQLGAAGIQVPTRHKSPLTTANHGESEKRRILYDDQRKANRTSSNVPIQSIVVTIQSNNEILVDDEDNSTDSWEQICDQSDRDYKEYQTFSSTDDSDNNEQFDLVTGKDSECKSMNNEEDDNDRSLSPMQRVQRRLERYHDLCEYNRSSNELRAPVICVLGHVDAGKTTILDNLRRTNVQAKEAGGITQQIGATNVPLETIYQRTEMCRDIITREGDFLIPGLLIIDTPGHETFKNLRLRGSSLCDLAILIVDIMHGLAPQTIESIQLLKERKTPFIIALNKIDLLYGWQSNNERDIKLVLQEQSTFTQNHFEHRCNQIIVEFAEQGLNVALYYKNSDPTEYYSMIPTSARSGDGMGSLIALIIETCQTSLTQRITFSDELQATVMEVKKYDDIGTSVDVVLVNGCLSVGDKIVIAGQEAPIVTRIRELLVPESNQELRVTNQYRRHRKIKGACGIKILANDLEKAMAGFPLFVVQQKDEIEYFQNEIEMMLKTVLNSIQLKDKGVYVQASTLGSLEAFLQLLTTFNIPYAGINMGPVHRKDVVRASAQLEKDVEFATILAFDVKIEKDAQEYAREIGVKILQNDEIYRLHDMFKHHRKEMKERNQEKYRHLAVFPCKLKILPFYVFNARNPIICGVIVEDGFIRLGTPICVPSREGIDLGRIVSIEKDHKSLETASKGAEVCIKIEPIYGEAPKGSSIKDVQMRRTPPRARACPGFVDSPLSPLPGRPLWLTPKACGRHFDENDLLVSKISRESIDIVKAYFRNEMKPSDWQLIIELKKVFQII